MVHVGPRDVQTPTHESSRILTNRCCKVFGMILEYTSVRLLLQHAASISRLFVYGKNSDGFDNNIVLLWVVITGAPIVLGF